MKKIYWVLFLIVLVLSSCTKKDSQTKNAYTKWEVNSKGKKLRKSEYVELDAKGNKIIWIQYVEKGILYDSFAYVYKNGLKTEEYCYKQDGSLFNKTVFTYDSNKKMITEKTYNGKKKLENYFIHKHFGSLEIAEYYTPEDEMSFMDSITYDSKNRVISDYQYLADDAGYFQKHTYIYDVNGNMIKELTEGSPEYDGIGLVETTFVYDAKNRVVKAKIKSPVEPPITYIYEYVEK